MDPPTAAAAAIYRMSTLTNLPFATCSHCEHRCFISHLHQLQSSCGINVYLFYLLFYKDKSPEFTIRD